MADAPNALVNLRASFDALASRVPSLTSAESDVLRGHVYAVVDELKGLGYLPERILIAMHGLAEEAGWRDTGQRTLDDVTGWCVRRYFDPAERQD
jgi:hypothetical protein